jgi:hypothetical protein
MSDTPAEPTTDAPETDAPPAPTSDDLTKLREALEKERNLRKETEKVAKANADAARRLAELDESAKTETQKLAERAEAAERALPGLQVENTRLRVALEKGIPASAVDRLRGETPEEIAADADVLLGMLTQPTAPRPPLPDPTQGRTTAAATATPGLGRIYAAYADSSNK